MELKYDNAATPQYNGNIGSTTVKTAALSGTSYPALTYNYVYDKLNRLTNAVSTTTTANDNFYNENATYDVMGNITKLNRYDKPSTTRIAIDSLTYTYVSGNKIDRVDDLGTTAGFNNAVSQAGEYTYDGNGNQLMDLNKGLTQTYNMLNLPQTAVGAGISVAYIYDAAGRKLRKLSTSGSTTIVTEYVNGIQYEYTGTYPVISFIQTEEGRARKNGTVYKYEYDLKDHLGNTRLTTTWDPSDAVNQLTPLNSQRNDYYAFGYTIQSLIGTLPSSPNHYLYNHKELQDETGLYDYGARFYDPVIGRWTSVDPLAEKGRRETPYGYAFDDPMRFTDPDGMWPDWGALVNAVKGWFNTPTKFASDVSAGYQTSMGMVPAGTEKATNGTAVMWAIAAGVNAYSSQYNTGSRFEIESPVNTPKVNAQPEVPEAAVAPKTSAHTEPEAPQGGAYKDLSVGTDEQRHHLVADAVSPVSKKAGPSIVMKTTDHVLTGSWGNFKESKAFQAKQYEMISQGNFEGAMNMGIEDVQAKFGTKYDVGIQQAKAYADKLNKAKTSTTKE
ncbi:RHS repeat domain-containing protein [Mucilaginibacter ginsenosidivorax]|uniref:RHS repeat-associated core domain-containing protein n=1 Tax=Mucilaginibacter ginsenosidivorax TaxID=862126 RepID=A0A5B8VXG9_9SPHI|nr:RHS repeat-associated core domain-containing protein [Mucilaginibacter ginsenosidivorax]QEC76287.1 RHS repeat-associated core domain-containing protein [Mucilaginibacter ginsenosidivorax]